MYTGEKFAVKRIHRLSKPWQSKFCAVWERSLLYHRNPYYLNIYFNAHFCITKIQTNHKYLNALCKKGAIPKTLYRILDTATHTSLLVLFYQLKYVAPKNSHKIQLQFNSSYLQAHGRLKILSPGRKYCLKLEVRAIQNSRKILDQYQQVPIHIKEVAYQVYTDIHQISYHSPTKIASIFETYPYSQTVLYESFQKVIGVHPSIVWRDRRLISFTKHLLQTEDSITNFYAQFGFSNASHLYKYFRAHFNTTPISFRKKHKKK